MVFQNLELAQEAAFGVGAVTRTAEACGLVHVHVCSKPVEGRGGEGGQGTAGLSAGGGSSRGTESRVQGGVSSLMG